MKRSEMTVILRGAIEYNIGDTYSDDDEISNILKALEEAGMLPPSHYKISRNDLAVTEVYEWENENETYTRTEKRVYDRIA